MHAAQKAKTLRPQSKQYTTTHPQPALEQSGVAADLLSLQNRIGNQATHQLLQQIRTELPVSHPYDRQEQEADHLAKQVTTSRGNVIPHKVESLPSVTVPNAAQSLIQPLGRGAPLTFSQRALLEPQLGYSLEQVRIHTGKQAALATSLLNAETFTSGHNIVFGHGTYLPDTSAGNSLLVHELAHVIQQSKANPGLIQCKAKSSDSDDEDPEVAAVMHDYLESKKEDYTIPVADLEVLYRMVPGDYTYPLGKLGHLGSDPADHKERASHKKGGKLDNWESRNAADIVVAKGTPVYAVADGVIGASFGPINSKNPALAGNRIHLITADNEFYYAHLSKIGPGISPGTKVKKGDFLGLSGIADNVPHLHISAKTGNPVDFFNITR
jgi:Domain of unknown function (DUF4157)/Peptidase family M23